MPDLSQISDVVLPVASTETVEPTPMLRWKRGEHDFNLMLEQLCIVTPVSPTGIPQIAERRQEWREVPTEDA